MKLITVAGPPSSGKTAVILSLFSAIYNEGANGGVVKFDCISTADKALYRERNIPVQIAIAGSLCPDHFFVSTIEDALHWGLKNDFDWLITESAGLCNRCSPHIKDVCAVCVIDILSGIHTPQKIGPMLRFADIIVITKGDIVSQAEREVFAFRVRQTNPKAVVLMINGITGQGVYEFKQALAAAPEICSVLEKRLRYSMPAALCSYCLGETRIGEDHQVGNVKLVDFK